MKNSSKKDGWMANIPVALSVIGAPLLNAHPEWTIALNSAIGLFGVYLQYNVDRLRDIVEMIGENQKLFPKDIVESEDFKEGFLVFFSSFVKSRGERKREIVKRIFLGFTSSKDKEKFDLEKLLSTSDRISYEAVLFLKKIVKALPAIEEKAKQDAIRDQERDRFKDVDFDWFEHYKRKANIYNFIKMADAGHMENWETSRKERAVIKELIDLGILTSNSYIDDLANITDFGYEFLKYLNN
jgi:hypothetical protein